MTIAARVQSQFDGATLFVPTQQPPQADGFILYNPPAVGIIDLRSLLGQNIPTDYYLQAYNLSAPGADTIIVEVLLPNGEILDITDRRFNVIIPQGAQLRITATENQNPVIGELDLWLWPYGHEEWPLIQECHAFSPCAPDPSGGGGTTCCPPVLSVSIAVEDVGGIPTKIQQSPFPISVIGPAVQWQFIGTKIDQNATFSALTAQGGVGTLGIQGAAVNPGAAGFLDLIDATLDTQLVQAGENYAFVVTNPCGCCDAVWFGDQPT